MTSDFGRFIDHTLLRPEAGPEDIRRLCGEAVEYGMAAVCVFPSHVGLARDVLGSSRVRLATVAAFPFGATFTEIKDAELQASVRRGADEVDIVINISALKAGDARYVEDEMQHLTATSRRLGAACKFIIETALLTDDEKIHVCRIANRVRPDFMKTSTGYGPSGATVADVRLMRAHLLPEIQIKAAGGIRSYPEAAAMLTAGAARLGTSAGVKIIQEAELQ